MDTLFGKCNTRGIIVTWQHQVPNLVIVHIATIFQRYFRDILTTDSDTDPGTGYDKVLIRTGCNTGSDSGPGTGSGTGSGTGFGTISDTSSDTASAAAPDTAFRHSFQRQLSDTASRHSFQTQLPDTASRHSF